MNYKGLSFIIYHLSFSVALALSACSDEHDGAFDRLSASQAELIGRGVDFNTSLADPFATRFTQNHDGSFNEGDIMTIYRQYSNDGGQTFDESTEAYRVYRLDTKKATGTDFVLERDWMPLVGVPGSNAPETTFTQTAADSMTWENGKTVRFRAWCRSNLTDAYANGSKERYYPDYMVSEWVTVSGPSTSIPLVLKHQGCRIGFNAKAGNQLSEAEICLDPEDYRWRDNNVERDKDDAEDEHGKSYTQAKEEADAVAAIYNRMCMPARIDIKSSLMMTMTKSLYDAMTDFRELRLKTTADGIIDFDTKTPEEIKTSVQRPVFSSNDGRLYMITIPYDMSSASTKGEALTLPPCTRFKIWLYDWNQGDFSQTPHKEGTYHIFSLSDIVDKEGNPVFPDGLPLLPGYSYLFSVGYHYDEFSITPADNFSWVAQDEGNDAATNEAQTFTPNPTPYKWWKDSLLAAIPQTGESYQPEFEINTQAEFLEFINLVNGTATVKTSGLSHVLDPTQTFDDKHPVNRHRDYRWYRTTDLDSKGVPLPGRDSVTHAVAEEEGYIFYAHYYPPNADQSAYWMEDYLKSPYVFYDENLNRHFTVKLNADLDFYDLSINPVGNETPGTAVKAEGAHPFRGIFEGNMHTLKNLNVSGGYLFRNCYDVVIRNLKIETTHDFKLIHTAQAQNTQSGYGAYVIGVSIKAPSAGNPIATTLLGNSYVVGCIYEGRTNYALVGSANNLTMYGNMMAGTGLPHNTGALLGGYAGSSFFFAPQTATDVAWGRFMVNYYLMDRYDFSNPANIVHAVGTIADNYRPQEYIRGALPWVLKAKNDNLLSDEVPMDKLTDLMTKGYYGLAPWKAMNYAIWRYNSSSVGRVHPCNAHFVTNTTGYDNRFPQLVSGAPDSDADDTGYKGNYESLNVLELNN